MNESKLTDTLNILRTAWKEGNILYGKIEKQNEYVYSSDFYNWSVKVERYMEHLFYNKKFYDDFKNMQVFGYDPNGDQSLEIKETLASKLGFLEAHGTLLKNGYLKDQGVGIDNSYSKSVFVAMWFNKSANDTYTLGIAPAIESNNYDSLRIDKFEHNDKIDNKILEKIRESRFLVADYTGQRGGVYFEAGYAKGLGLQVIAICHKNDFDNLHFDVKMYNTIIYEEISDLKLSLENRIKETIGIYKTVSSPVNIISEDDIPF